jgi:hypothetical protein
VIVNTNKIIFCPFCFFFYFSATQTTPSGFGGCPPSPSGVQSSGVQSSGVQSSGTLRSCPPSAIVRRLSSFRCLWGVSFCGCAVIIRMQTQTTPAAAPVDRVHPNDSRTAGADTTPAEPQRAAQRAEHRRQYRKHHQHKEKPRNASGAVCVGFISTVSRFRQVARRETESSK